MPLLDPPVPIFAQDIINAATVTFNHPLIVGPLDPANWSARFGGLRFAMATAGVGIGDPTQVQLTYVLPGVPDPGFAVVDYTPPPSDVISDTARQIPAAGFLNYPLSPP